MPLVGKYIIFSCICISNVFFCLDPCIKVHCGAGRVCQVDPEGEPQCVCIPSCPVETESRRKVCTNYNETWTSDCAVYQQRCFCSTHDPACKGEEKYKHVHIEYYGECRQMKVRNDLRKQLFIRNSSFPPPPVSNLLASSPPTQNRMLPAAPGL